MSDEVLKWRAEVKDRDIKIDILQKQMEREVKHRDETMRAVGKVVKDLEERIRRSVGIDMLTSSTETLLIPIDAPDPISHVLQWAVEMENGIKGRDERIAIGNEALRIKDARIQQMEQLLQAQQKQMENHRIDADRVIKARDEELDRVGGVVNTVLSVSERVSRQLYEVTRAARSHGVSETLSGACTCLSVPDGLVKWDSACPIHSGMSKLRTMRCWCGQMPSPTCPTHGQSARAQRKPDGCKCRVSSEREVDTSECDLHGPEDWNVEWQEKTD